MASKQQAVSYSKDTSTIISTNDPSTIIENGKLILPRDGNPRQINIQKDGYLSETKIITPYKRTGLYWAGITINIATGFILSSLAGNILKDDLHEYDHLLLGFAGISSGVLSGVLGGEINPRLINYTDSIDLNVPMLKTIKRDSTMKEVYLNKTSFNLTSNSIKYQFIGYNEYLKGNNKLKKVQNIKKDIKIENSIFTNEINNILKRNGFVDTSGLVLKGGYGQNLFINTTINELNFTRVACNRIRQNAIYVEDLFNCFSTISIKTKWELLDIYKNIIYSDTFLIKSSELLENHLMDNDFILKNHINNAVEKGLFTFMNSARFMNELKISDSEIKNQLNEIVINKPKNYVKSLEDAVMASVTITSKNGHGSGLIISEDGLIATNYHVIADSTLLEVILNDGNKHKTTIVQINKEADLAILKIDKTGLKPFLISDSNNIEIGKDVFAIGTPKATDLSQTISKGIISALRTSSNGSKIIQTDSKVNSGNSGGPLVDTEGNLIGVVNAKHSGLGVEGISFAIPANIILPSLNIKYN